MSVKLMLQRRDKPLQKTVINRLQGKEKKRKERVFIQLHTSKLNPKRAMFSMPEILDGFK